jgi:small-conductance mechanosensitive channel
MSPAVTVGGLVRTALEGFVQNVLDALPALLTGTVFLVVSYVGIRLVLMGLTAVLSRAFDEQPAYVQLGRGIVAALLWFGVLLSFLTAVGLGDIAASLGTASGFVALGVSYALSDMIKDVVAGVYLLRDPDFDVGDRVVAGDTEGVVEEIELRKTRFSVGTDTVVRANAEVEKKWTRKPRSGTDVAGTA